MNAPHTALPQPSRWGLKTKLILSMLLVGVVPLAVGLGMAFWRGSEEIRDVSGESFKALATEAARKIDLVMAEEIARTVRIANDPAIVRELEQRRDSASPRPPILHSLSDTEQAAHWAAHDPAMVKAITDNPLAALLREYYSGAHSEPDHLLPQVMRSATKMLFLTDAHGTLVAAMKTKPDYRHGETAWWRGAFNNGAGKLYIEDVHFHAQAEAYVFTISIPIMDSLRYEAIGVLHRVIDAKEFFSPSTHAIRFGKTGHVMLIDSRGIVMSCPILPTGLSISDKSLVPLITPLSPGWVHAPSDGHGGQSQSIIGFAPLPETSRATNGSIEGGSWHTFVWQSSDELFAPIGHLLTWMTIFGAVGIVLLVILGYVAAGRIVTPVRQLQQAARLIGRGELRIPLDIRTGDELQDLADEFTRMNTQLEAAFAGLTDQVTLKTQEVEHLQQSTQQLLDAVPTPILLVDADELVHYVNQAGQASFNLHYDPAAPAPLFSLLPIDPAIQAQLRQEFSQGQAGTGTQPEQSQSAAPRDPLAPTFGSTTTPRRSELPIGGRVYHYQWFRLPGKPGEGFRIGLILRDTTEESRLQDQLIQAEKRGSLGVLTAGIGHELNNPLFGIVGLGEAIQEETDLSQVKAHARDIVAQGQRMAGIIRDFTGVTARDPTGQQHAVILEQELDHALATTRTATDMANILVHKEYAGETPVRALPDQVRQAFTNLLTNAVQAMQGTGTLRVSTAVADQCAVIRISDSGTGISPQHLSKIFDPFFTTKGQGDGSGLGLTVARRIIRKFGGDIRIESVEGHGTTCIVTLPVLPPAPQEGSWSASASQPQPSRSS
ncbi:MAG: ATP-binding protein [Nitrospira sp.]